MRNRPSRAFTVGRSLAPTRHVSRERGRSAVDFQAIVVGLFAILIGLAFVFAGFRLFLILLPIWGFFAGWFFGAQVVATIFGTGFLADVTGIVVGFVCALIFAIASYLWYWLAVTILGASVGYAVGTGLIGLLGISNNFVNVSI